MQHTATLLLCLALAGCSTINYTHRAEGWPELREELHVVSNAEMQRACKKYASPFFPDIVACSEYFFDQLICRIWVTRAKGWEVDHERGHCQGFNHPMSNDLDTILARYKEKHK